MRLTELSPVGGCGCKLSAPDLLNLTQRFAGHAGIEHSQLGDAAFVTLPGGQTIVSTVDFMTPVVDDAYDFGYIAAIHSMSDLFAVGARPVSSLNIVAWPQDDILLGELDSVLAGAVDAVAEHGGVVQGGHTARSGIPLFGLALLGLPFGDDLMGLDRGRPGDLLVLTKPLGTGVISSAIQAHSATDFQVAGAIASMKKSNLSAAQEAMAVGVKCATDVSGFGLAGHVYSIASRSGLAAEIDFDSVPTLDGAIPLLMSGVTTSSTLSNQQSFVTARHREIANIEIMFDPQTSGGLLLAVPEKLLSALRGRFLDADQQCFVIGRLLVGTPGEMSIF